MQNNRRHFTVAGVLVILGTLAVYWLLDTVLVKPVQAVVEAEPIDYLFDLHLWLIAFLFSLVVVFMIYALVIFRARDGDESEGEYFHSNTRLEIAWTVVPLVFVVFYGYLGTDILLDITSAKPDEMTVGAVGFQWGFRFEYPESDVVTQELVLPVGRPIKMELSSTDVLHDFWIPEFRVKQDMVPGKTTYLRFTPSLAGDYVLRCAELCGQSHAYMLADVRVLSQADYDAWWAEQTASQ